MNSSSDFGQEEMDLLAQAERDSIASDAEALAEAERVAAAEQANPTAAPAPAPAPAVAAPAPAAPAPAPAPAAAAPAEAPAPAPAPAPAEPEKPKGDVRAALRASRFNEQRLRDENERLRKQLPAASPPAAPKLDPAVRTDLETYAPAALTMLTTLEAENARLRQLAEERVPAHEEFIPDALPAATQTILDEDVPELDAWRTDPTKQHLWAAAIQADTFLSTTPQYTGKPVTPERFREAYALVQARAGIAAPSPAPAPAAPTPAQAQAVIDAIPITSKPVTAGSLGSGSSPTNDLPDYHRMAREGMSDEAIIASLA